METFPRYWPFVRAIHRSPVNSPHKGQWRGALVFSFICARINGWVNNRKAGDLRRHRGHYDVNVMCCANYIYQSDVTFKRWPSDSPHKGPTMLMVIVYPKKSSCNNEILSDFYYWLQCTHARCQDTSWTNVVNWTIANKLQLNFNQNVYIFIQVNAFENVGEFAAILSRPQCVKVRRVALPEWFLRRMLQLHPTPSTR